MPQQLSEHVIGSGPEFFAQACRRSLEGIVSKQLDAPYQSGRARTWCKAKCVNTEDFVIVGFSELEAAGGLAALLLAEPRNGTLTYVGKVGTGFSAKMADDLRARLEAFASPSASLAVPKDADTRNVTWTEPKLMAEVRYATRTEGRLRQASFLGLRQDRMWPPDVPKPEPRSLNPSRRRLVSDEDLAAIWVTNPDRVMFGPLLRLRRRLDAAGASAAAGLAGALSDRRTGKLLLPAPRQSRHAVVGREHTAARGILLGSALSTSSLTMRAASSVSANSARSSFTLGVAGSTSRSNRTG